MILHHPLLCPLCVMKWHRLLAGRWVRECAGHSHWSLLNAVTLFCAFNCVIFSCLHFRNLHFNNILRVYCKQQSAGIKHGRFYVTLWRHKLPPAKPWSRGHQRRLCSSCGWSRFAGILANLFPFIHRYNCTVCYAMF